MRDKNKIGANEGSGFIYLLLRGFVEKNWLLVFSFFIVQGVIAQNNSNDNEIIYLQHYSYNTTLDYHLISFGGMTLKGGPPNSAENFIDSNGNGIYDFGESFSDFNINQIRNPFPQS